MPARSEARTGMSIHIRGKREPGFDEILTPAALDFLKALG